MDKNIKIQLVLSAIDKMSGKVAAAVSKSQKKLRGIQRSADRIARAGFNYGRQALQVGAVAGAMLYPAINSAVQFEQQMGNVATLIDTNVESMQKMGSEVLAISAKTPVAISDLTSALYDVRSAGIASGQAMSVLEQSAVLATAGLSTTKEATNIMTSSINAFASEGRTAAEISDILFKTVKFGKTTVAEISQAFGATAPIVQKAGVSLAEFQAATAALTTVGTPAAQAQNQIRASVVALQKPTANMQKVMRALGVKDTPTLIAKFGDLGAGFKAIVDQSKKMGYNLEQVAGRVEASAAMSSIAGATNEAYLTTLEAMTTGANAVSEAYGKQTQSAAAQIKIARNAINASMTEIGSIVLPILVSLLKKITPVIRGVTAWAKEHPTLTKFIFGTIAAVSALLTVFGTAGMMIGGISSGISAISGALAIVAPGFSAAAVAAKIFGVAFMGIPIIGWIAAIIAAGIAIYAYWDEISAYFMGMWDAISGAFDQGFMQGVWEVFKQLNPMYHIAKMWGAVTEYFFGINLFEAGSKILDTLIQGIASKITAGYEKMKEFTTGLREYLPFSPAKTGPLKDLHRVKIVETIAQAIRPDAALQKMKTVGSAIFNAVVNPQGDNSAGGSAPSLAGVGSSAGGGSYVLQYSPSIYFGGQAAAEGEVSPDLLDILREHGDELLRILETAQFNKNRRSYS